MLTKRAGRHTFLSILYTSGLCLVVLERLKKERHFKSSFATVNRNPCLQCLVGTTEKRSENLSLVEHPMSDTFDVLCYQRLFVLEQDALNLLLIVNHPGLPRS